MSNIDNNIILKCDNLSKSFYQGDQDISVLKNINLEILKGSKIAITGESGSGKSTFLQIISGLQKFDDGGIHICGVDLEKSSDRKKTKLRLDKIGFVYQYHHLLSDFTALENVVIPALIRGDSKSDANARAKVILERMGLKDRIDHKPSQLSGGQQQRVAIARSLINDPEILIADEPTGNLDQNTTAEVMNNLLELTQENQLTLVIATHNKQISGKMDRVYDLSNDVFK